MGVAPAGHGATTGAMAGEPTGGTDRITPAGGQLVSSSGAKGCRRLSSEARSRVSRSAARTPAKWGPSSRSRRISIARSTVASSSARARAATNPAARAAATTGTVQSRFTLREASAPLVEVVEHERVDRLLPALHGDGTQGGDGGGVADLAAG
jgi:hypothetical protein